MEARPQKVGGVGGWDPKPANLLHGITYDLVALKKRAGYMFLKHINSNWDTIVMAFNDF